MYTGILRASDLVNPLPELRKYNANADVDIYTQITSSMNYIRINGCAK